MFLFYKRGKITDFLSHSEIYSLLFSFFTTETLNFAVSKTDTKRMILQNISILNYKNIRAANLELSPKMNCLIGHNGEGKTNFLDAVY